jgi:uncharacterized protein (DUF2252 family)
MVVTVTSPTTSETNEAATAPLAASRKSAAIPRLSPAERAAAGKAERKQFPLSNHAEVARDATRSDPIALLEEQATSRLPELVPIRYGRMLVSPFTFYRGAARVMASDLAATPHTNLTVQLCGDAHLSNFGLFGSPERRLVFDINDFDETLPGPFEWDVKRLCASLSVAARSSGFSRKQRQAIVAAGAARYRTAIAEFAAMRDIDVWYAHLDTADLMTQLKARLDAKRQKVLTRTFDAARTHDSTQALKKLTAVVDGQLRIKSVPPLIVPVRELVDLSEASDLHAIFRELIRAYRRTLQPDRRALLERYHFIDMARKVVGVGSVGTRCWIILLMGRDEYDPLFLQVKEAGTSVLAEFLRRSAYPNQGQRVVAGQRLMQQSSDIFLGWQRFAGIDGTARDFYFRQLRDWKGAVTVEALLPLGMQLYAEVCAWSLARAHARSGDRIGISAYLGKSDAFDRAMVDFSETYADVTEKDHRALADAVAAGRVSAETGL